MEKEKIQNYHDYADIIPFKLSAFLPWYIKPRNEYEMIFNNVYLAFVLFILINLLVTLLVNLYVDWIDFMSCLNQIADGLPLVVSIVVVVYFAYYDGEMAQLQRFMRDNFKYHSARGITNTTMLNSYKVARNFARFYTACCLFSVTMYTFIPMIVHLWTKLPPQQWVYVEATRFPYIQIIFLRQCLVQALVGLIIGQLGVFFATNSILICGQLDLVCCSVRNARYTALLQHGVLHSALAAAYADIRDDERHSYTYNIADIKDSVYHYDKKMVILYTVNFIDTKTEFDIYSRDFDQQTIEAIRECARLCQAVAKYKDMFEHFISPVLALRVIHVTLYLCMLMYSASVKFDMVTVEYVAAVAFDILIYCYYGNQIIIQADRVSTAVYQSAWHTMGPSPRKYLLHIMLSYKRPANLRAGRFLTMHLETFVSIMRTSFSYYMLLVNVNDK
uniref:Odorant receptor n=1 Tax=Streltzoviella insularis TaxID=1206366 RepID=A0A7D5YRQ5_9NEOP|nr:odorant receptor 23 [Streltzoviella insularis]